MGKTQATVFNHRFALIRMTAEEQRGNPVDLRLCYVVSEHKDTPSPARDDIAPVCCLALGSLHQYNKSFLSAVRFCSFLQAQDKAGRGVAGGYMAH